MHQPPPTWFCAKGQREWPLQNFSCLCPLPDPVICLPQSNPIGTPLAPTWNSYASELNDFSLTHLLMKSIFPTQGSPPPSRSPQSLPNGMALQPSEIFLHKALGGPVGLLLPRIPCTSYRGFWVRILSWSNDLNLPPSGSLTQG